MLALAGCAGGPLPARIDDVAQQRWHWAATLAAGVVVERPDPARYWFEAARPGAVLVQADCNSGVGGRPDAEALVFGPIALTRRFCGEGSLDAPFARHLGAVRGGALEAGLLRLAAGDSTLLFVRDAAARLLRLECGADVHELLVAGSLAYRLLPAHASLFERVVAGDAVAYAGDGLRFTRRGNAWSVQGTGGADPVRCRVNEGPR